jgi:hypothetical protein
MCTADRLEPKPLPPALAATTVSSLLKATLTNAGAVEPVGGTTCAPVISARKKLEYVGT